MPAKDFLDLEEKKNLQKALKEEERAEVRERILMFLLLNDGKTQREIADFIGCSLKTVAHWCVHGDPNNLESLEDGRKNGNHKKATEEYINLLLKIVDEDPKEFGYEFGRWTAASTKARGFNWDTVNNERHVPTTTATAGDSSINATTGCGWCASWTGTHVATEYWGWSGGGWQTGGGPRPGSCGADGGERCAVLLSTSTPWR